MKIAVLGNCQADGIADALRLNLPKAEVHAFVFGDIQRRKVIEVVADKLTQYDLVFAVEAHEADLGPLRTEVLLGRLRRVIVFPVIAFNGFQPDMFYLRDNGRPIHGPLGPYHSYIICAGYALGLPVRRTAALFNAFIYSRLGYFAAFANSRDFLVQKGRTLGYDLGAEIKAWIARGSFMLTINHPKQQVLDTIAQLVAVRAGLCGQETKFQSPCHDRLSDGYGWPVYPEIARKLSVHGSLRFKLAGSKGEPHKFIDLAELVARSFQFYKDNGVDPARLSLPAADAAAMIGGLLKPSRYLRRSPTLQTDSETECFGADFRAQSLSQLETTRLRHP